MQRAQAMLHARVMLARKDRSFKDVIAVLRGEHILLQTSPAACRPWAAESLSAGSRLAFNIHTNSFVPDVAENIDDDTVEDERGETIEQPPLQKVVIYELVRYLREKQ